MISETAPCSDQRLFDFVANTHILQVRTHTHPCVSLIAPIIGSDFIAGIDDQSGRWVCIAQSSVESLVAQTQPESQLPLVRNHPGGLSEFLAKLPTPTRILVRDQLHTVSAFSHGWAILLNAQTTALSLAGVEQFELFEAPDSELLEVAA